MTRLRVAVLYGGRSGEHEVSLLSADSIMEVLNKEDYEIIPIRIEKNGQWGGEITIGPDPTVESDFDVVFPILHGPLGEDGSVQGLLELANVPYVGAGVAASAAAMDKALMRALFDQANLPLVPWEVVFAHQWCNDSKQIQQMLQERLGFPMFVKPANLGSSVGISKAKTVTELGEAVRLALKYDRKVVVEQAVQNAREIECSVLGNDEPEVSVPGEIVPAHEFYDYEAKYHNEDSRLIIPAPLSAEQNLQIRDYARRAFQAVDCAGMGRVDFLLDTKGQIFVNEINTIPGFTQISMYPKLWEKSGLSYGVLLDRLIELALERHGEKQALRRGR